MRTARVLICCLPFFLIFFMSGWGNCFETETPPVDQITIAYNEGNPPIKFQKDGRAEGILIDIWKLWSRKTGVRIIFKKALFSQTLQMVLDGDADVHGGMFYTDDRDQMFDYSLPILDINYMIYFHESISGIDNLQDLANFKVGVPEGYTHTFVKKNIPGAAVSVYKNFPELFSAAMKGQVKAFLSPVMNHQYYFQTHHISSPFLYNTARPAYTQTYYGAVKQGNQKLLNLLNRGFEQIRPEELVDIQRKWIKGNLTEDSQKDYIVACSSNQPPFSFINTRGQPAGFYIDIWRLWAKKMDVDVRFIFNTHAGSIEDLNNGLADFHAGFPETGDGYLQSTPFYKETAKVFLPVDRVYQKTSELSGLKIAALDKSSAQALKKRNFDVQIVFLKDLDEIFKQLSNGLIDGFIFDETVIEDRLYRQGRQGELKEISDFACNNDIAAILMQKDRYLQDMVNHGLSLISEREFREIEKKWFKQQLHSFFHSPQTRVELNQQEKQWLKSHPVLKLGIDPDYPPYEFFDDQGHYVGIAADYMALIQEKLGVRLDVVKGADWQQVMEMARNRQLDMVAAANKTPERSQFLLFTEPYLRYPIVAVTMKTTPALGSLDALSGKRIALVKDYAYTELLLNAVPDVRKIFVDRISEGLKRIAEGKADAIVGDLASLAYQIQKYNLINLKINSQVDLAAQGLAVGVREDYPVLASILNKTMAGISEESHIRIRQKWVALDMPDMVNQVKDKAGPQQVNLTPAEKQFVREHPVITLGVDPLFIPFEFFDEKDLYSGIASDYVKLLNERLGINMQVVPNLSWSEAFRKAVDGEIDLLPCVGVTRERLRHFNYSQPYTSRFVVIVTRQNGPMILELSDLSDKRVAVQQNTFHEGFVRERTSIQPMTYPSMKQALMAVSSGKTDAFIGDVAASSFWIKKMHLTNLKVAGPADFKPQTLHFAVQKKYPELVSIINKGLDSISPEEKTDIRSRWISLEYEPGLDPAVFWRYLFIALFCSAILMIIFLLWNYSLKKEINERRRAEEKIVQYAEELKKVNINLEGLDKLKSMFIASMSHELRTPLNSIIGFTGVILQGMSGEVNEQQKDQLGRVYTSAKHLLNLISDVIDISKIEAGRVDVYTEEFSLMELINEAVLNVQPQLEQKGMVLEVRPEKDIIVNTDRKRLLQCLINYLSNAVKYSEEGTITVLIQELEKDVEIKVADTGIGIPGEEIPKLFNAFERISSRLKVKAGGTGLGLYLTRKLAVEILDGSVSVESTPGVGSTFGIRFSKNLKPVLQESNIHESLDH